MKAINKGLKLRIYPSEDIVPFIHQYIGNARFVWNNILSRYKDEYESSKNIRPTLSTFNAILKGLKEEFLFLKEGESTSLQQVIRDLVQAFNSFFQRKQFFSQIQIQKTYSKLI